MSSAARLPAAAPGSAVTHTVAQIVAATAAGHGAAQAHAQAFIDRAQAIEPQIHAFKSIDAPRILAQAGAIDAAIEAGAPAGPLAGLPVGVKDIIDVEGWVTGMGSPIHDKSFPARDSRLVARLKAAGAHVFGKTVTTEFAFMHPRETRNPWHRGHTPGGSSSGSAAAVAAGCVPAALATQTNGSVIRPAAFCGIVGFKPSYGAFSADGVLSYSPTLDQPGCYARSVADVACVASVLAEPGFAIGESPVARASPRLIAVRTPVWRQADAAMQAEFARVCSLLESSGAVVEALELPVRFDTAHEVHRLIMAFEATRYFEPVRAAHRALLSDWLNAYLDQAAAVTEAAWRDALAAR
jgi:Asp-tRNA(Asn)/Glu-tRNA(Gln) amidotransferase A subunit family amidase